MKYTFDIKDTIKHYQIISVLRIAFKLNLFDNLKESISIEELSKKLSLNKVDLTLITQILAAINIIKFESNIIEVICEVSEIDFIKDRLIKEDKAKSTFYERIMNKLSKNDISKDVTVDAVSYYNVDVATYYSSRQKFYASLIARELKIMNASDLILDIGGSYGYVARNICEIIPKANVHIYDFLYAKKNCEDDMKQHGFSQRVNFFVKDIEKDRIDFQYNSVIMSGILHFIHKNKFEEIIIKISKALKASGILILIDYFLDDDKSGPIEYLIQNLEWIGNDSYFNYSVKDMVEMLEPYNFKMLRQHKHDTRAIIFQKTSEIKK